MEIDIMSDQLDLDLEIDEGKPEKKRDITPEEGIDELRSKLLESETARQAAEQRARDSSARLAAAENEVGDTHLHLVVNAIDTVKRNNEILRANMAQYQRIGDFDKAAELQEQISTNAAKLVQLENGKTEMEARPKREPDPVESDPVEALAARLTPKSAAWLRAHPEFARDQRKNTQMISAHNLAVAKGLEPESPEYFETVEGLLDLKKKRQIEDDDDGEVFSDAATVTKRRSPPAAPVERSGTAGGERKGSFKLTRDEAEAAASSGLTPLQYYENKLELRKQGRLN